MFTYLEQIALNMSLTPEVALMHIKRLLRFLTQADYTLQTVPIYSMDVFVEEVKSITDEEPDETDFKILSVALAQMQDATDYFIGVFTKLKLDPIDAQVASLGIIEHSGIKRVDPQDIEGNVHIVLRWHTHWIQRETVQAVVEALAKPNKE